MKAVANALPNNARDINIFSIKDTNANTYQPPFFQRTPEAAIRLFKLEVNRADQHNLVYQYPEDFELHYLGTFNEETGEIKAQHQLIASAKQLKNP